MKLFKEFLQEAMIPANQTIRVIDKSSLNAEEKDFVDKHYKNPKNYQSHPINDRKHSMISIVHHTAKSGEKYTSAYKFGSKSGYDGEMYLHRGEHLIPSSAIKNKGI